MDNMNVAFQYVSSKMYYTTNYTSCPFVEHYLLIVNKLVKTYYSDTKMVNLLCKRGSADW